MTSPESAPDVPQEGYDQVDDKWRNYEGPFDADYATNSYKKEPMIFIQPGTDQYPSLGADEGTWVKKSSLYRKTNSVDEPRDN